MSTDNRAYYDAFSRSYDHGRDRGYHRLIDEQAAEIVRRWGTGARVLEVGCGTGLVLERVAGFAAAARGVDLSPGMLERARERGLEVVEGSATDLPFSDASFDLAYSFKVLAHVPEFERAVAEMVRVVRPGGHVIFDVYNRASIRCLVKRLTGPRRTSKEFDEAAIATRFRAVDQVIASMPEGLRLVGKAGIRVATVHPAQLALPGLGALFRRLEWWLMDSPAWRFGGFVVLCWEKPA